MGAERLAVAGGMGRGLGVLGVLGVLAVLMLVGACSTAPAPVSVAPEGPPAGVRLLTGAPEGGFPYRLLLSEQATAEHPHRLVVWLHPSGASGLGLVEPLASEFASRGWALLTLPEKDFSRWKGAEANRLMLHVVPEVARVPGVDARRPVLLGFSAGAQMALEMGAARAEAFGGMVLLSGSPRSSRGDEVAPPPVLAAAKLPLLVLVGETDGDGPAQWRAAQGPWSQAGLPLRLHVISGRGHEWLLMEAAARDAVLSWLEALPPAR